MKLALLLLVFCCDFAWSQTSEKPASFLLDLIQTVREPGMSLQSKRVVAQEVINNLRSELKKEFPADDDKTLFQQVSLHPEKLDLLKSNLKYKNLFTQLSRLVSEISSLSAIKGCEDYQGILEGVTNGDSGYSPCMEGSYEHSYMIWGDHYSVPSFVYSENLDDLLLVVGRVSVESSVKEEAPFIPSIAKLKSSNSWVDKDERKLHDLLEQTEMRKDSYFRSMFNALRNRISMGIQYGRTPMDEKTLDDRIKNDVLKYCQHCTPAMKNSLNSKLNILIKSERSSGKISYRPAYQVKANLCQALKVAGYPQYEGYKINEMSPVSYFAGKGAVKDNMFHDQRVAALSEVARTNEDGLLLLTDSLTNLDAKQPERLKLKCTAPDDKKAEVDKENDELIFKAAQEAQEKALEYVNKMNEEIHPDVYDHVTIQKDLQFFLRTNPRAFGEALNRHPNQAHNTCTWVEGLKYQDDQDKLEDTVLIWGAGIVGGALTVTGIFAPAGAALTMGALALGTNLALSAKLGYDAYESKEKAELMEAIVFATKNPELSKITHEEYLKYQSLKISAMINLAFSAVDASSLILQEIKASRNIAKALDNVETTLKAEAAVTKAVTTPVTQEINQIDNYFTSMRSHINRVDYVQTATVTPAKGVVELESGVINSQRVIRLEPVQKMGKINTDDLIESVTLRDTQGNIVGKVSCVKNADGCIKGAGGQPLFDIPLDNKLTVELTKANGQKVYMDPAKLKSIDDLPDGFRPILPSYRFSEKGFAGAHSEHALMEGFEKYKDIVKPNLNKVESHTFKIPGSDTEFTLKSISYEYMGNPVKQTKNVIAGGDRELLELENALKPIFDKKLATPTSVRLDDGTKEIMEIIEAQDGTQIKAIFRWNDDGGLTWFLSPAKEVVKKKAKKK